MLYGSLKNSIYTDSAPQVVDFFFKLFEIPFKIAQLLMGGDSKGVIYRVTNVHWSKTVLFMFVQFIISTDLKVAIQIKFD